MTIAPIDFTTSQVWRIENKDPVRPQTLTLRNVYNGRYLDVGANPASGQIPTLQYLDAKSMSQQWFIKPAKL